MIRNVIIVCFGWTLASSADAQETDRLRLLAYAPKCGDYVVGYSIDLMAEGRLVGHPEKSCDLEVDYSDCSTVLCRVGVQLSAWRACVSEKAEAKLETICSWSSEKASVNTPVGNVQVQAIESTQEAEDCFRQAVSALRERMIILLSPAIAPEEQEMALSFNDQIITSLKTHEGAVLNVACGQYMDLDSSFPDLPTAKALRLALLTEQSTPANRVSLFALMRLAFETNRTGVNLSRENWFSCFTEFEISYFVFRSPLDELILKIEETCDLFLDSDTRTYAFQDFEGMKS